MLFFSPDSPAQPQLVLASLIHSSHCLLTMGPSLVPLHPTHAILYHASCPQSTDPNVPCFYFYSSDGPPVTLNQAQTLLAKSRGSSSPGPAASSYIVHHPFSQTLGSSQITLLTIWRHMFPLPKIAYPYLHLLRSIPEGLFNK